MYRIWPALFWVFLWRSPPVTPIVPSMSINSLPAVNTWMPSKEQSRITCRAVPCSWFHFMSLSDIHWALDAAEAMTGVDIQAALKNVFSAVVDAVSGRHHYINGWCRMWMWSCFMALLSILCPAAIQTYMYVSRSFSFPLFCLHSSTLIVWLFVRLEPVVLTKKWWQLEERMLLFLLQDWADCKKLKRLIPWETQSQKVDMKDVQTRSIEHINITNTSIHHKAFIAGSAPRYRPQSIDGMDVDIIGGSFFVWIPQY